MIAVTFAPVSVNSATLEIEDISSFAVDCWTEDEVHSLMIVNTVAGQTSILTYGPLSDKPRKAKLDFEVILFRSPVIIGRVQKFLLATQAADAEIIDIQDAISSIKEAVGGLII